MTDYFGGARALSLEDDGTLQQTQAAPAAMDYFSGARSLDMPQQANLDTGRVGQFAPGPTPMQIPEKAPRTWGDTATDVAKSAGVGVAQGVLGIGTLPGNVEQLARMGIDKGAQLLGYENPQTQKSGQWFPHYGDAKGAFEQVLTGKFYQPQTVPGEYARTVGEFAPMVAGGGGGVASKVASTLGGGIASEAAGQMTKGTAMEPWARMAGGIVGTSLPAAAARVVSPNPVHPERARQMALLDQEGVTSVTAGQRTGSRPLQWHESVARDTPFSGSRPAQLHTEAAEQFTRATLRRAGIQADRATTDVIDGGFVRLGNTFDRLEQHATVAVTPQLSARLQQAVQDYNSLVADTFRAPMVNGVVNDITQLPQISGASYGALRSALDKRARAVVHTDPPLSETLFSIRNVLDDAVEQSLPRNLQRQYAQARREYGNLITIVKAATGAGEDAAMGLISPAQLRNAAKTRDMRGYARGRGDLDELARAGTAIMTPLPQSGTGPRAMAQSNMHLGTGAAGFAAFGPAGLAATAVPALSARALMSGPAQNYLANQAAVPLQNALAGRPSIAQHMNLLGPMVFGQ